MLHQEMGDYGRASALYEELLQRNPEADAAANNLAMLLVNHGADDPRNRTRALELVRRFEGSDQGGYLDTLGWVQLRNGRLAEALRNLEEAMGKTAPSPEMHYHLGIAYLEAGRVEDAKTQLLMALEPGQSFPGEPQARQALERLRSAR
jgi:Flp pilus assembly protein TadD